MGHTLGSLIHVTEPGDARATRMLVESAEKGIGERYTFDGKKKALRPEVVKPSSINKQISSNL